MKTSLVIPAVAGLLLLSFIAPVANALWMDPGDILYGTIVYSKPAYQNTPKDYLDLGNKYKAACAAERQEYFKRVYTFRDSGSIFTPQEVQALQNPTAEQQMLLEGKARAYDDGVKSSFERMINACDMANKCYNKALDMTGDDDYKQQAEIFDAGAGMYDDLGLKKQAEQVRNAAAVARAHAAAQKISLPLSLWIAVFAIMGGLILIQRKKS